MDKAFLELLEKFTPAIRDAIIEGIQRLRDEALLNQVIDMIERQDVNGALRALGYNPALFSGLHIALTQTLEAGGLLLMAQLPQYVTESDGVKTRLRYNVRDPRAEKWLAEQSSRLITGIEDDIRLAVRDTMVTGVNDGRNSRSIALDIVGRYDRRTGHREGGSVGLGAREQYWSQSARQKLLTLDPAYFEMELRDKRFDATVRAAIASGKPLSGETVDKLVTRYRARALKHRGETIGRTEALAALNRSEFDATKQAIEQAGLPPSAAEKIWDTAGDDRVRHSHRDMDGQKVTIDEPFVSPTGARLMHPGDTTLGAGGKDVIACRCKVRYKIDFTHGVE